MTDQSARDWFETARWPETRMCPRCGSTDTAEKEIKRNMRMPYRCNDCDRFFSVRIGTIMEHSRTSLDQWKRMLELFSVDSDVPFEGGFCLHEQIGVTRSVTVKFGKLIRKQFIAHTGRQQPDVLSEHDTYSREGLSGRPINHPMARLQASAEEIRDAILGVERQSDPDGVKMFEFAGDPDVVETMQSTSDPNAVQVAPLMFDGENVTYFVLRDGKYVREEKPLC